MIVCVVLLLGQPKYELPNAVFEVEARTSKNIPFSLSSTRAFPATTSHILKCIKADGNKVSLSKKFQTTQDTILLKNLEIEDSGTYEISFHNEDGGEGKELFQINVLRKLMLCLC